MLTVTGVLINIRLQCSIFLIGHFYLKRTPFCFLTSCVCIEKSYPGFVKLLLTFAFPRVVFGFVGLGDCDV